MDVVQKAREGAVNFGTHNGIFHCDEVVGIAILELAYIGTPVYVRRTRNAEELKELDVVIDVGGGEFDHHIANFNTCRPSGEKYASAGLVWRSFGEKAIMNVLEEVDISTTSEKLQNFKEEIDKQVILPVDLEDNGEKTGKHVFSFIPDFLPPYFEEPDFDACFEKAEKLAVEVLKAIIKTMAVKDRTQSVKLRAKKELEESYKQMKDGILQIQAQNMSWQEIVVEINKCHDNAAKVVIFSYPAGGWAAQAVPPSMEEQFSQLVPFPKEWAGANAETLPEISGVSSATFCHNGRVFARAETKEDMILMCKLAIMSSAEKNTTE